MKRPGAWPQPATRFLLAGIVALGLCELQREVTNQHPFPGGLTLAYYAGELPLVFRARVLLRWLMYPLMGPDFDLPRANVVLQTVFLTAGLLAVADAAQAILNRDRKPSGSHSAAPWIVAGMLPWTFLSVGYAVSYPYDLPAIYFSAAAMGVVVARRYWLLCGVMVIGILNKESLIWVLPGWALWELGIERDSWRRVAVRGALLLTICAVAYAGPRGLLRQDGDRSEIVLQNVHRSGRTGTVVPRWETNLQHLAMGYRGSPLQNAWWVLALQLPALVGWRSLPSTIKVFYAGVPVLLIALFFSGNLYELRLFNDLLPLGAISAAWVLGSSHEGGRTLAPGPNGS